VRWIRLKQLLPSVHVFVPSVEHVQKLMAATPVCVGSMAGVQISLWGVGDKGK
jgi:hypothetical protein